MPREVETSSVELLRRTREEADTRTCPMATHAAYSVLEFQDVVREHMMTPIELLDDLELLRPTMNIGHGNFIADNPNLNYAVSRDLELMGRAGVTDLALPDQHRAARPRPRQLEEISRRRGEYLNRFRYVSARHDHEHADRFVPRQNHEP